MKLWLKLTKHNIDKYFRMTIKGFQCRKHRKLHKESDTDFTCQCHKSLPQKEEVQKFLKPDLSYGRMS